jgi:flagellar motor switch protein FliN/FliY
MTRPQPILDLIKSLPPSAMKLDGKPLFGYAPPFPWEQFSAEASSLFGIEDFKIAPADVQWRTESRQFSGLGGNILCSWINFAPLEGAMGWAMSKSDISTFMQLLLHKHPTSLEHLDSDFQKGFYYFIAAQAVNLIGKLNFDRTLSPSISEEPVKSISKDLSLCLDVTITANGQSVAGRAIISPELYSSWKARHNDQNELSVNSSLAQKLTVIVHIELGKTSLTKDEWSTISTGDFILLDSCSYEPDSDKGRVMLTIGGERVFRAKLKQGNIKILEFPLIHEVDPSMNTSADDDDDFDQVNEEAPSSSSQPFNAANLPINLVVEAGRLQMTVQQLMELQPGNLLELDIHPENGVDLVVNGQRIGKGELLKIGETLGIRILSLG